MVWFDYHRRTIVFAILWLASAAIFWFTGHAIAGFSLLVMFVGLPAIAAAGEKARSPEGHWWVAPVLTFAIETAIVLSLAWYAISKI